MLIVKNSNIKHIKIESLPPSHKKVCLSLISFQVFPLHLEMMTDRKKNWDHITHSSKLNPF